MQEPEGIIAGYVLLYSDRCFDKILSCTKLALSLIAEY